MPFFIQFDWIELDRWGWSFRPDQTLCECDRSWTVDCNVAIYVTFVVFSMIKPLFLFALLAVAGSVMEPAGAQDIVSESASDTLISDVRSELEFDQRPQTLFEARRAARRAVEKGENYLNSRGYFAPEISYSVAPGEPPLVTLSVEPGPLFVFSNVSVDTGDEPLSAVGQDAIATVRVLASGETAIPKEIIAEEAGLVAALKAVGYADARALERSVIGDREAGTLELTYRIDPGPRIRLGKVIYESDTRVRQSALDRLIPFQTGEFYSPQAFAIFSRRLNATRNFSFVSVQLAQDGEGPDGDGVEVRDVVVQLEDRDRYTLSAGTSFSTSEGPGLTAGIIKRNASRRGDTVSANLTLATLERALKVDWRLPNVTAFERTLVLSAEAGREETDAFDREALTLTGALEVRSSNRLTYALGVGSEFTREEDAFEQRDQQILSTFLGIRLDYADDPLDATEGWRIDARAEPGVVIGDREAQYLSLNGQISAYQGLDDNDRFVVATRLRSGFVFGAALSDLPVSRRFFAGGGGSARGFEYQSVGPRDIDGTPTGGRGLLEVSSELRWRRDGPLGFVAFLDGATVTADQGAQFDDIRYSAGIGVRYDTLVGPIRFDVATPINPRDGEDPLQFYVSIGQAF